LLWKSHHYRGRGREARGWKRSTTERTARQSRNQTVARPGTSVICEARALPLEVIPAKAGIQSLNQWNCVLAGLDSRLRGNDRPSDPGGVPSDTTTQGRDLSRFFDRDARVEESSRAARKLTVCVTETTEQRTKLETRRSFTEFRVSFFCALGGLCGEAFRSVRCHGVTLHLSV
jgi:alpha-D-ribose 1-methylphosphonate 5-phosphate C-P lyase